MIRFIVLISCALQSALVAEWIKPPQTTDSGYPVPQPGKEPHLPRAHGAHFGYGIEWWYWVGHLEAVDGDEVFGFQSTVFRLEGAAAQSRAGGLPTFGDQQLYMAHSALSNITAERYQHNERIYREGWQANAKAGRLDLAVGGIKARMIEDTEVMEMSIALDGGNRLELTMTPVQPLVAFGERGLSRKGADPAAVSWYWTYPRLRLEGRLIRGEDVTAVSGNGWMDHESSSSQLGGDVEGWDWTAIQLDDGTAVKAYRLRRKDGSADPWSAVYWIDSKGITEQVYAREFIWEPDAFWKSPATGNRYPNAVTIRAQHPGTGEEKVYRLRPFFNEQEFVGNRGDNAYWEGACEVMDASGQSIGRAYLELAGYGGGLGSRLTN